MKAENSVGQTADPMADPMAEPMDNQQTALPAFDPMNLTVSQFIERCDKINPLVCMGLNAFIEANSEALANEVNEFPPFCFIFNVNIDLSFISYFSKLLFPSK